MKTNPYAELNTHSKCMYLLAINSSFWLGWLLLVGKKESLSRAIWKERRKKINQKIHFFPVTTSPPILFFGGGGGEEGHGPFVVVAMGGGGMDYGGICLFFSCFSAWKWRLFFLGLSPPPSKLRSCPSPLQNNGVATALLPPPLDPPMLDPHISGN